ncbi:restriction endonuclease subunit S [Gillisia sp. M10.2A]|uniref:Restriction endonuclease subunit S n=1 Tax=Gillisia lutea TaxID=2909668 RepID=A0ABS9EFY0_9FLAO|nr:restriction endonuclease subunit S [Gillisia lutea]MCF4101034.1 restriction endonuclease subunit S [Gillisia lutea]
MGSWREIKVKDVAAKIQYGYTGKTHKTGEYRYLRITDIQNSKVNWSTVPFSTISDPKEIEKYLLHTDDIIFARTGATVGKSFIIEEVDKSIFASYLIRIQLKKDVFPKYLYLYFQSSSYWQQIRGHEVGAAQPNVNGKKLGEIVFPLPSIQEQKRIVTQIDYLFEKLNKGIVLLEENIIHSQALINSVLDEEFGKLEEEFESKPLEEIVTVINGRAYQKPEMLDAGKYPILRVGNFFSNRGWYYSDMELDESKYCEEGDLLYAWSASFGPKIWDGAKSIYHYHIWKMVPTSNKVSRKYLYYLLERDTDKIKEENGRGVGMIHITKSYIESRMMVLPPMDIQEKVVERIEKFYFLHTNMTLELNQKLDNLKALKSSLLDQAFKGEL